jgi:glycosyltransferase involved in cell wall biosynthesis
MKPKLMILIDTGIIGGPGKGLFQFLNTADQNRFDYVLCNFLYPGGASREFINAARQRGLNLRLIRQSCRFDPSPVWQAYRIAAEEECNVIQSHGYKSHLIAAIVSRILHIPWIAISHGWTSEDFKVRVYHALDQILLKQAEVAVAVSPPLYSTIAGWRGQNKRTEMILNAVDSGEIPGSQSGAAIRKNLGILPDTLTLGCFGRLSHEKGQSVLLSAIAQLLPANPNLQLLIVGDGPAEATLRRQARSSGIERNVTFLGHQSQMRGYYEAIDLLVIPSYSEGLPNVLLESMSLGVPVLATNVGAVREVITHRTNGWVVHPGSAEDLCSGLAEAIADRSLLSKMGDRARASLNPKFSATLRSQRLLSLYDEVIEQWAA